MLDIKLLPSDGLDDVIITTFSLFAVKEKSRLVLSVLISSLIVALGLFITINSFFIITPPYYPLYSLTVASTGSFSLSSIWDAFLTDLSK